MKKIIIYIGTLFIVFNCQNDHSMSQEKFLYLRNEIIKNGNSSAYVELATYNEQNKLYGQTLPYSIIMINKFNYKRGYSKVAEEIISINNNGNYKINYLKNLNIADKNFVLYYLNLGLQQNDIESILLYEKIYRNGWGVEKNLIRADSLSKIYNSRIK